MNVTHDDTTFRDAWTKLQAGQNAIPWTQRRELGRALGEAFEAGMASDAVLALTHQLAGDPKWEVRNAIAEALPHMPAAEFAPLAERLGADPNAYVRRSVARAVTFRQKTERAANRARRSADQVHDHLLAIERAHGKTVANQALRLCDRYSGLLVGSMVHDLRSILTHLKANCQRLIDESTSPQTRTSRHRVRDDLDFLELAIADMETFSQPIPQERKPERLADVIATALDLARDNVHKQSLDPAAVEVTVAAPEGLVVAMARHQIVMALTNVLKNAFEAFMTGAGKLRAGRVTVEVEAAVEVVRITITDNGMGLSEEEAQGLLMFTPSRRNKTKHHSTGYGLPIAARNIMAHGGLLALESRENEGTTVTITLPLARRQDSCQSTD